eukprot:3140993-Rhodomonas_salina.1
MSSELFEEWLDQEFPLSPPIARARDTCLGSRVQGLGSWVLGLGSRVLGLGSRVQGPGSRV